jgi:antirestriction protein ArdC
MGGFRRPGDAAASYRRALSRHQYPDFGLFRSAAQAILWGAAEAAGYRSPHWMTFKQALEYGACVRKGERGTQIVFANHVTKTETNERGEDIEHNLSFLKSYSVFNAEQIDGLPARFAVPAPAAASVEGAGPKDWLAYAMSTAWFDAIPAEVIHRGEREVYIPSQDRIVLAENFEAGRQGHSDSGGESQ